MNGFLKSFHICLKGTIQLYVFGFLNSALFEYEAHTHTDPLYAVRRNAILFWNCQRMWQQVYQHSVSFRRLEIWTVGKLLACIQIASPADIVQWLCMLTCHSWLLQDEICRWRNSFTLLLGCICLLPVLLSGLPSFRCHAKQTSACLGSPTWH